MKISKVTDWKKVLGGCFAIFVIVLFAYSAIGIYKRKDQLVLDKLEKNQSINKNKMDSIIRSNNQLQKSVDFLRGRDSAQTDLINITREENIENFELLKNQKDEKDYVTPVSYSKQLEYISNYKYSPVK